MSNIGGNYNFGVWNPPSGLDAVKHSESINFNIATKLNNLQTGKEKGFKQNHEAKSLQLNSPDMELIVYLNDNNLKIFTGMVRQGWGG